VCVCVCSGKIKHSYADKLTLIMNFMKPYRSAVVNESAYSKLISY